MNIPDSIRIGGVDYTIHAVVGLNNGVQLSYGHIDFDKTLIRIGPHPQDYQGMCITLLHEALHGICHHMALELGSDEKTITALAKGLYMLIVDNPDLCKEQTNLKPQGFCARLDVATPAKPAKAKQRAPIVDAVMSAELDTIDVLAGEFTF